MNSKKIHPNIPPSPEVFLDPPLSSEFYYFCQYVTQVRVFILIDLMYRFSDLLFIVVASYWFMLGKIFVLVEKYLELLNILPPPVMTILFFDISF